MKTEPLRALLSKNVEFKWNYLYKEIPKEIKDISCSEICLAEYNASYDTILSADAQLLILVLSVETITW